MEFNFSWVDGFATLVAVVVGLYLNRVPWWNTKFVPLGKLIVIALIKIATALGIGPAAASSAFAIVVGVVWWKALLVQVLQTLLDTFAAVGAHSGPKNVIEGIKER